MFLESLAAGRFLVYIRENIFALLPDGARLSDGGQAVGMLIDF